MIGARIRRHNSPPVGRKMRLQSSLVQRATP